VCVCKRKYLGPLPSFNFIKEKDTADINSIILNNTSIKNLSDYSIKQQDIEVIDIWNEFIQNIKGSLPGFPVWADRLCALDPNEDLNLLPSWKRNFIIKNNNLFIQNKTSISAWLLRANKLASFKGSKAKFEWQAGQVTSPDIWSNIMHFRPSGLRVKKPKYFPALVAITHTSIIGSKKRYLTPREGARLQSFPDSFILNPADRVAYKQLGNSVNVSLVKKFTNFLIFNKII
jgi:DNA (cytosine-5)-methyltransferase 1